MEYVKPSFLFYVRSIGLTPIQEIAEDTCLIHSHLSVGGELSIFPHTASVYLAVRGEVICHSRAKVGEFVHNAQVWSFTIIDGGCSMP